MYVIDHDFFTFNKNKKKEFENNFRQAYINYLNGDWHTSQNFITACLEVNNEDGPSLALSEFMDKYKNYPPEGWLGYRDIDAKDAAPSMSFIKAGFDDNEEGAVGEEGNVNEEASLDHS